MSAPRIGPDKLTAAEQTITMSVRGLASVGLQLVMSALAAGVPAWSGTVSFEATIDGINWVALNMVPSNSASAASSATASGIWTANVGGFDIVRARVSAYTAGWVEAWMEGSEGAGRF